MTLEARTSDILRFGNFEVDLRAGQLRKQGKRIKLQEQPFQVLSILLQRPNDVVTREELRSQIWQQDTFVDFDNSLNTAINKLRDALGDSVVSPRFIETLPRRGYRFLAPVAVDGTPSLQMAVPTRDNRSTVRTKTLLTSAVQFGGAVLAIGVVASLATGWLLRHTSRSKSSRASITLRHLTTNANENGIVTSAISPDGKYLAYSDKTGAYLRLLSTGELHPILPNASEVTSLGWSPDSSQLVATWAIPQTHKHLWTLSILGGNPRQLSDEGWSASVSPDGTQIVFLKRPGFGETGQEIWLMRADGADQRRLLSFPEGGFASPVWAPDGRSIAYLKFKSGANKNEVWIELFDLEQGSERVVLSDPHLEVWGFIWLPDGRLVYAMDEPPPSQNSSNFWAASIDLRTGHLVGPSTRLTSGDGFVAKPSVTADGKHLVFNRAKTQVDVYVSEFSATGPRLSTPRRLTFDDADDLPFDWTPDNKTVLFISNRTGTTNIFRQRTDQTSAEMLVVDQEKKSAICRLSPDGSQILYSVPTNPSDNSQPVRLMRALINGGPPQVVLEAPAIGNYVCSRAPAAICAFGQEEPKELVISVFDPVTGRSHEVAKLQKQTADWGWALSPDGTSIAALTFGTTSNRIRLLSLSGQPARELVVKNWSHFVAIDWAADSKGLFVASNPVGLRQSLLYIDLAGGAHQIWQVDSIWASWAIPSRNGKYLAIPAPTVNSNVWMAENF